MTKLAFVGTSHAAQHLSRAAELKGFALAAIGEADVVFVSEDTPTWVNGERDLDTIRGLVDFARRAKPAHAPLVLTSAVPPGFCRSLGLALWHQAETLRMRDAAERAANPEMLIVGCREPAALLPAGYAAYLQAFDCPILTMTWEEAEFAKVAINCFLAAQVDTTNRLAAAARQVGAAWAPIAEVLSHDARIGPRAYLTPGRWQESRHLLRDMGTLHDIEARP